MMKPLAFVLLAALAGGCGTTQIIASDSHARIFVNGDLVGKGEAEIRKRGWPSSSRVVVKTADGREGRRTISRGFTLTTFLLGLVTYYACMVACWEYPDSVFVQLEGPAAGAGDVARLDPWLAPPPGWAAPNP